MRVNLWLLIFLPTLAWAVDAARWDARAPIVLPAPPARGIVSVPLPDAVFDQAANANLHDLRVIDARGREIGYVLEERTGVRMTTPVSVRLFNRLYLPGQWSRVTLDLLGKPARARDTLAIETAGRNFRRAVRVEGSDDGRRWATVSEGQQLIRVTEDRRVLLEKDTVTVPDNRQRYLRLTVFTGSGELGRVEIEGVRAWQLTETSAETARVRMRYAVTHTRGATLITIETVHRHLPLASITLAVADLQFYRRVSLWTNPSRLPSRVGSQQTRLRQMREAGISWARGGEAVIYRFPGGGPDAQALTVAFQSPRIPGEPPPMPPQNASRYMQVRIEDGDNPPLEIQGLFLRRYVVDLQFAPTGQAPYTLLIGNPNARAPEYDLPHLVARLRAEGVTAARVGAVTRNPSFRPALGERQMWLWVALVLVFLVLFVLIRRQLAAAREVERQAADASSASTDSAPPQA